MPGSRRKLFGLKATVAYLAFATAWIFLSDSLLEQFSDPHTLARYGMFKGMAFVLATAAILWFTLMNAPTDADVDVRFGDQTSRHNPWVAIAWGLTVPSLAALVQWTWWEHLRPFAWVLGYPALLVSAWLGGWVASLVSTGVSASLAWIVFAPTHPAWSEQKPSGMIAMGIFVSMGIIVSASIEWMQRAERRSGNSKFQALVEQSLAGIYIIQADRFVYVNPAFARMMGYEHPQQIIGQLQVKDLVAAPDREKVRQQLQLRFDHPGTEVNYGFTAVRRDGTTIELEVHGRGLQTVSGNVVIGMALDVTDRQRNEIALREKQALLDRMSALAKVGGWSIDVTTGTGTRTDGAARILDLDPSRPDSLSFQGGLSYFEGEHHDRISQALQHAAEQGKPYSLELQLVSAQGKTKWVRTQGEPIWQDGRVVRIEGAIQDISEVRQARAELQAHQEHLEQMVRERTAELEAARHHAERLSRIKSEFLANMSHEIRTPLNGVLGLAQIGLRDHQGPARQIFEQINTSGRLLLGVINDILDFSKIEAGKLHIDLQPLQLRGLLERAMSTVRERADEKGLTLSIEFDASLPATCVSDALRLEQVLLNLLSNAVKFTQKGEVRLSASAREGRLMLAVTDTGIGMNPAQIDRLFRPFEQADGSTTRRFGGTGLGLTISRRLVEMLGGEILTRSEPGVGTRFEVWLPLLTQVPAEATELAMANDEVEAMASKTPASAMTPETMPTSTLQSDASGAIGTSDLHVGTAPPHPQRLTGLRVLAAEDNAVNQLVLTELLAIEGAQVAMCESGADAVVRLQTEGRGAFDVVLMDIQMPGMDGYEATRQMRAFAPDLPIIGQTAHAMAEEHHKCRDAGMVDLVVKPIELEALVAAVKRHAPEPQG